jgi:hypothetical protein
MWPVDAARLRQSCCDSAIAMRSAQGVVVKSARLPAGQMSPRDAIRSLDARCQVGLRGANSRSRTARSGEDEQH